MSACVASAGAKARKSEVACSLKAPLGVNLGGNCVYDIVASGQRFSDPLYGEPITGHVFAGCAVSFRVADHPEAIVWRFEPKCRVRPFLRVVRNERTKRSGCTGLALK